ncbi:MAG: DUF2087 domain-containing protein [Pelomonas sp.]|nr:DUF2087 domain-containing protein [Roseateles sp.]
MPRDALPLVVDDLSAFAKSLRTQLLAHPDTPGHQTLLNMVARAAGHRNLQTLTARPPAPAASPPQPVSELVRRTLHQFDPQGRLTRLPAKRSMQFLALWGLWMRFDAKRPYRESEVNQILNAWHAFGDHCTLRRDLVTQGFLARTADSAVYTKLPARPDADGMALMRALRQLGS